MTDDKDISVVREETFSRYLLPNLFRDNNTQWSLAPVKQGRKSKVAQQLQQQHPVIKIQLV